MSEESLEVLGEKWSCRCGFIGDTAEEVWEHQEDECDHCPEIATGDAQQEPLVSIHAVRTLFDDGIEHLEAMKCGEEDCEKCIGIDQALTAVRTRRDKLEEFTQNGPKRGAKLSEEYQGLNGSEIIEKAEEDNSQNGGSE